MKKSPNKLRFIAYCGLYCPKCYKMKIAASAEKLLDELEPAQKRGDTFLDKDLFLKKKLTKLVSLRCTKFCREGGGKSSCPIKTCCIKHNINGCWECSDLDSCKKLKPQFTENSKRLRDLGLNDFIKQYYETP